ncbi:MAG: VCBS repeat-containing protein [Desulfatibacillum sp.]|nr:VCBS repeat-containing protein [Desulfatibacillum sp.]
MKTNTIESRQPSQKDLGILLAELGSTMVLSRPDLNCAMAVKPGKKGLKHKVHHFSSPKAFDSQGALTSQGWDEIRASGLLPGVGLGAKSSQARLIARGAATALMAGAFTLFLGTANVQARDQIAYFGGANPFEDIVIGSPKPAFVDIDADGDMDLFVGAEWGQVRFFENKGQAGFAEITDGNPLSGTWVGDLASPAFVDIDGDGDMDCFVGTEESYNYNYYSAVSFFENVGTPTEPVFEWQVGDRKDPMSGMGYNPLWNVDLTYASPTFADIDGDGDMDAFVGGAPDYGNSDASYVLFYENVTGEELQKNGESIRFSYGGVLTHTAGFVGFETPDCAPAFMDADGDGDLDLFVGGTLGNVGYYKNIGDRNTPLFQEVTDGAHPLNINTWSFAAPAFTDVDGDGRLDAVVGSGFFNSYDISRKKVDFNSELLTNQSIRYYRNVGTSTAPKFRSRGDNPFNLGPAGFGAFPTFGDIDGDGDLDAMVGHLSYFALYLTSSPSKTEINPFFNKGMFYYENTGTAGDPVFVRRIMGEDPFREFGYPFFVAPATADLNDDGVLETYFGINGITAGGDKSGPPAYVVAGQYDSEENLIVESQFNPMEELEVPFFPAPAFVDIDGDGDLDAFVSGMNYSGEYGNSYLSPTVSFFLNEGTPITPGFAPITATNPLADIFPISDTVPISQSVFPDFPRVVFGDMDGDGDNDAVLGAVSLDALMSRDRKISQTETLDFPTVRYFENTGGRANAVFTERTGNANPFADAGERFHGAMPTLADVDNDGDVDAFISDWQGSWYYYRHLTTEEAIAAIKDNGWDLCFVDNAKQEESLWQTIKKGMGKLFGFSNDIE